MAIVKMVGIVDDVEIIFKRDGSDWVTTVPKDLDGEYVISVTAYDEAGNKAYSTSMLFIVDPSTLRMTFAPLNYSHKVTDESFNVDTQKSDFTYYQVKDDMSFEEFPENFKARVVI